MSNAKLLFALFVVALATLTIRAHNVRFYELKKGNLRVNFTNFGARIVSLDVPDKFGNVADIVLGYDSDDAYQEDKYSFGAIVGWVADKSKDSGGRVGLSKVIWKVLKHDESKKLPFITFQYHSHDDEEGFPGNLIITVTYLLHAKSKLQITLHAEAKDDEETPLILAQNIYWNLGGHNSPGNILHDHLRVLASSYRRLDDNLVPTGRTLPVKNTPYDFLQYHPIKSRFRKLRNGYKVDYLLDHRNAKDGVELAAVLRDKKTGRVMKVWTDQALLQFRTGDEVRNVRGKGGVLYQKNSGLVLSAQGYSDSEDEGDFPPLVITKEKPYKQTTVFQFLIKKKK